MENRYEIRGKIGQGGLGAVYRGYDNRMHREVAIKRISSASGDLEEESTKQLIKEAGALASLQHPHIVTIYDVGSDDDGPYVVMELISGKTLDELIERAPLTWPDFKELAMQTQEALIAAQDLDLIHSDLKPSNLMLTWLPSGKFQVKIVDFGLATLTQSQSAEDLHALDTVFGSIFFMPPEQFERLPLDGRSDLYSIGCVYYQALTGLYPFNGEDANEVMEAHLNHTVVPIQEVRADIPLWACNWIMWLINRYPQDRPVSAREALSLFIQNDKNPNPTMSAGSDQSAARRPRLIIPGAAPQTLEPTTAAVPTATTSHQPLAGARITQAVTTGVTASLAEPLEDTSQIKTKTAPQPLTPPEGSKPSVHTSSLELPEAAATQPATPAAAATAHPTHTHVPTPVSAHQPVGKTKMSNAAKGTIAAILALLVVLLVWYLLNRSDKNRQIEIYNEMITMAAKGDATEVPVNAHKLDILLEAAVNVAANEQRQTIYKALFLAKATDGTDVDARIAEFATNREMIPDVREVLIRDVLRKRKNPSIVPTLIAFASSANDPKAAVAALQAVRFMAGDDQFDDFLKVIQNTPNDDVRKAAEETAAEIIGKSSKRGPLASRLAIAYDSNVNDNIRHSLLRLLGRCGGPKALELVQNALQSSEQKEQVAAIVALGSWGDDTAFPLLTNFLSTTQDLQLRDRAFDAAYRFVSDPDKNRSSADMEKLWRELAALTKIRSEMLKVVNGLAVLDPSNEWAFKLIEGFANSEDDQVADRAGKALEHIRTQRRLRE